MKQREIFAAGEGDRYFERNPVDRHQLAQKAERDPLLQALAQLQPAPTSILEVGASNGWRLACAKERLPATACVGIDPSAEAARDARRQYTEVYVARATAERLPFAARSFDFVMLGFCLYLCDRDDLFAIAAEVDRVVAAAGHVAIYDFHAGDPHRTRYAHHPDAFSFKMDYARLFSWNPLYRSVVHRTMSHPGAPSGIGTTATSADDATIALNVLQRRPDLAYPERPLS